MSAHSVIHVVGFSGGIDSQACARWVLNRYRSDDVVLLNTLAGGNEHPLTEQFIADYSRTVHPVVSVKPLIKDLWLTAGYAETRGLNGDEELTFEKLISIKGRAPSRTRQFCTQYLKLHPLRRWITEHLRSCDYIRYTGIRREEGGRRLQIQHEVFDEFFDCQAVAPLFDWSKMMCFEYVKLHGEPVNPLYKLGFSRVGCAPCINSSKEEIANWAARFPAMIDKIRAWEQSTGRTFFAPMRRDGKLNHIDDVVAWSRTRRGGKELSLEVLYDRPACESKYGLCE